MSNVNRTVLEAGAVISVAVIVAVAVISYAHTYRWLALSKRCAQVISPLDLLLIFRVMSSCNLNPEATEGYSRS